MQIFIEEPAKTKKIGPAISLTVTISLLLNQRIPSPPLSLSLTALISNIPLRLPLLDDLDIVFSFMPSPPLQHVKFSSYATSTAAVREIAIVVLPEVRKIQELLLLCHISMWEQNDNAHPCGLGWH